MGLIGKIFAIMMFPLGILIILESLKVYSLNLGVNKIFIGAALMIILQLITIFMVHTNQKNLSFMNILTAFIFISVAIYAILSVILKFGALQKEIPLILGLIMFIEGLYALH